GVRPYSAVSTGRRACTRRIDVGPRGHGKQRSAEIEVNKAVLNLDKGQRSHALLRQSRHSMRTSDCVAPGVGPMEVIQIERLVRDATPPYTQWKPFAPAKALHLKAAFVKRCQIARTRLAVVFNDGKQYRAVIQFDKGVHHADPFVAPQLPPSR